MVDEAFVMRWLTVLVYNAAIIRLVSTFLRDVNMRDVMREKTIAPRGVTSTAPAGAPPDAAAGGGASPADGRPAAPGGGDATSYSRVTGLVGATIMACFLWALGNVVVWNLMVGKGEAVSAAIADVGGFFLGGASLFAPYAFNQLKEAFRS